MNNLITCYIGLGGNIANELGTPAEHITHAIEAFRSSDDFANVQVSSLYRSKAFGVTDQPDFINAVLKADTSLAPLALLDFCQSLETTAKRERLRHWGERSLDVDVLLYGDATIQNERLTVPHAGLFERNFVIIPMLELSKDLVVNGQRLADLPIANNWQGLEIAP
ncbi:MULTISPECIES: 2-amino-4-hydroxy-6-hydroxymethyldihydropteridine diphosphokinase [unclassified Moraxella]|uniref:2-amino-4-hydroxy-6- hydroxymethyldihydropteridine diphosphokinase n=1 Tax=unclassified Moraxella TaxID=2685852 RepID=UPI003AF854C7